MFLLVHRYRQSNYKHGPVGPKAIQCEWGPLIFWLRGPGTARFPGTVLFSEGPINCELGP